MTDVIVTAIFHPAPGAREKLVDALRQAIPAVHEEKGCVLYAIHDAEDESIVMLEKWASKADLDAHAEGPAVQALNALIGDHLASPVVVTLMKPIPAGTENQGIL